MLIDLFTLITIDGREINTIQQSGHRHHGFSSVVFNIHHIAAVMIAFLTLVCHQYASSVGLSKSEFFIGRIWIIKFLPYDNIEICALFSFNAHNMPVIFALGKEKRRKGLFGICTAYDYLVGKKIFKSYLI